jgi:hypothetical protein
MPQSAAVIQLSVTKGSKRRLGRIDRSGADTDI